MKQSNFILTDIMKSGNHLSLEGFIKFTTLEDQTFDLTGEYYTIHNYNLKSYNRRFAIVDVRLENKRLACDDFYIELGKRMDRLQKLGFVFIYATPWESEENVTNNKQKYIPQPKLPGHKWYGGVSWFWYYMILKHIGKQYNPNHYNKKYDFLYLNKEPRKHRIQLYDRLKQARLIENSLVSFVRHPTNPFELPKEFELPWLDPKQPYPAYGMDQDVTEKPYEQTLASIVSETNDNDTDVFITEKLWKAILMKHVFVVHGNYQYLKKLKELGFKTFDNVVDESYDNEKDKNLRIEKLIGTLAEIRDKNAYQLYEQTEAIRVHNQKWFWNKNAITKVVNDEILLWLKFFDSSQVSSTKS